MGLTEDRLSPIVAPQPTYRQKKTHTFQISNLFRKTLAILALVALFSVACAAPQRALLQDETATAAPAPTTAPATDEIDTAANTTTTTEELLHHRRPLLRPPCHRLVLSGCKPTTLMLSSLVAGTQAPESRPTKQP